MVTTGRRLLPVPMSLRLQSLLSGRHLQGTEPLKLYGIFLREDFKSYANEGIAEMEKLVAGAGFAHEVRRSQPKTVGRSNLE